MARPENISDIDPAYTTIEIATVQMDHFSGNAARVKAYSDFVGALAKLGITMDVSYNTVRMKMPKTPEQLRDQLKLDQDTWDRNKAGYEEALRGEFVKTWRQYSITAWAESEGLAEPVFIEEDESVDV
jgi:hypothetical protein